MGRSGIGSWRHRSHVGRFENEEARRTRAASARRYISDYRYGRVLDAADNVHHGRGKSARRAKLDYHRSGMLLPRNVNGAADVFGSDWLDRAIDDRADDLSKRGMSTKETRQRQKTLQADESSDAVH